MTGPSKRSRAHHSRKRLIASAQARRRAERHVINRLFKGAVVQDGAEARLSTYFPSNFTSADVWVVYKNSSELALKNSEIVLVCKRTGRVIFDGPKGDEG